jgi:hypothetical protein
MEQDREKWTGKIKKKLSEHSEPVSKNSWESLLNEVSPDKNISQKKGRFGQYIKYVAAACLAVLLGTGITVYYLSRETSTIVNASAVTTTIQVKNNSATAVKNQAATQLTARVKKGSIGTIVHSSEEKNHTAKTVTASDKTDSFPSNNTANNNLLAASNNTGNIVPASGKSNIAEKSATKEIFTEKELFGDSVEELDKAKSKKGTRKSHFNNSGTLIAMYTGIGAGQIKSFTAQKDMLESPNSTAFMGSLNNIKLENNLFNPAFLKNEDLNYKMPVSYGIAVRKYMINNISIESGLYFTKLSTEFANNHQSEQNLWYIGIPLKIGYSIYNTKRFDLYASAGGSMEICISAKYKGDYPTSSLKEIPLQFSINAAAGAQFLFTPHFGLFIEPGLSHFFKKENSPYTFRRKHPTSFNLNIGFRINIR